MRDSALRRLLGLATGLAVSLSQVSCVPDAGSRTWAGTRTDSAGIVIVQNPDQGLWSDSEGWVVEEDVRIGSVDGGGDDQFGQVGGIAVNAAGDIYVSDRQRRRVSVWSRDGTFLRAVGREGSGPGELGRGTLDVLLTAGDTLLVPDVQNRRINRYAPDGTSLPGFPLEPEKGRPLRFNWNATSRAITVQLRPVASGSGPTGPGRDAIRVVASTGAFADTLLEVPTGGLFEGRGLRYFTPEPIWDVTDSLSVVWAVNDEYRIFFHAWDGSLQRIVAKSVEPRSITERDIRAFFAYLDRAWIAAGVPPSRLPANHRLVNFAEFFPAFASFQLGLDGSLWVQPVQSPADLSDEEIERYDFVEDFGAPDWDVFDAAGRYLGVVSMPPRFQPRLFHEDAIFGVQRDELDVQYVVRLRVREKRSRDH